jgi:hypothetical protein
LLKEVRRISGSWGREIEMGRDVGGGGLWLLRA